MSSGEKITILKDHPKAEDYRMLIENAWKDLHHSRLQEWSSLGVVTGVHLVAIQIVRYSEELRVLIPSRNLPAIAFAISILFALIGAAITCRHRKIMSTKMNWIWDSEIKLGLMKTEKNNYGIIEAKNVNIQRAMSTDRFMLPRIASVSFFILVFYVIFVLIDLIIIVGLLSG
jgi:hypothetical protein